MKVGLLSWGHPPREAVLNDDEVGLLMALIRAEAQRLNANSYQHVSEYPPRLKKLARVWRKLATVRYGNL